MKKIRKLSPFFLVICFAAFIRLTGLAIWPPVNPPIYPLRLITAIVSIITIILIMLIVHKLRHEWVLTFLSGLMMAITPWHVEQSRVMSQAMWALGVMLFGMFLLLKVKQTAYKVGIVIVAFLVMVYIFPQLSDVFFKHDFPKLSEYLQNWFKLVSVEFLFYKNDSFWLGGLRTQGAFLFSTIPIFLLGLFDLAKNMSRSFIKYFLIFVAILSISAAAPKFPEEQIFFLTVPFFVCVLALGIYGIIIRFKKIKPLFKVLIVIYSLLVLYDYVLFTHFYVIHYANRIRNEMPIETIKF